MWNRLSLSCNEIEEIDKDDEENIFELENLKFLGLFGNQIKEIKFENFKNLKNLEKITILDNPISSNENLNFLKLNLKNSIKSLKWLDDEFIK